MEAYPLKWPEGWPRHKGYRDSDRRFRGGTYGLHWDRVYRSLQDEIARIGGSNPIISTNQPVRQDGLPYAQQRSINDPGVAVYFTRKKKQMVMAQDRFDSVAGNMRSLAMAIEGLRQMERHGGAVMLERAFDGFIAIAPPSWKKPWREVFGIKPDWKGNITALYREKARNRHPDAGGSDDLMAELNVAFEEAKRELA